MDLADGIALQLLDQGHSCLEGGDDLQSKELRNWGVGFRAWGVGFRAWGLGKGPAVISENVFRCCHAPVDSCIFLCKYSHSQTPAQNYTLPPPRAFGRSGALRVPSALGHSPDELVELLGALRQRVDVELRPEGVAVLVDHGRMIDVDLVNLLKESEVLLQLQKPGRQLKGLSTLFMV